MLGDTWPAAFYFTYFLYLYITRPEEDLQLILHEDVEIGVASMKTGKSVGVDNIPAVLVQAGGETMIEAFMKICNRIWRTQVKSR